MKQDPNLRDLYAASPEASEAMRRCGDALASLRLWRLLMAEGGEPSVVDGELRAHGCWKLSGAKEALRDALRIVEALHAAHPDVLGEAEVPR